MEKLVLMKLPEHPAEERYIEESLGNIGQEIANLKSHGADPDKLLRLLVSLLLEIANPVCNVGQFAERSERRG